MALRIERELAGRALVLTLHENVDTLSAPELDRTLQALVSSAEARVVVDLADVPFVSSAGFGALLQAARVARRTGARIVLCGVGGSAAEAIRMLGIGEFLPSAADRMSALIAVSEKKGDG